MVLPGLKQQIATFNTLPRAGALPSDNALHILLADRNDYNEAIPLATSITDITDLADQVTDNIASATSAFFSARAKNVLVSNLSVLGLQPFAADGTFTGICANPDKFFFWDDVHPTAAGHSLITQAALKTLADNTTEGNSPVSVPEPGGILALFTLSGMLRVSTCKQH